MNANRRQFLKVTAAGLAVTAAPESRAADPFAPAEPGLLARWFNKGQQHVLPRWAFDGYAPAPGIPSDPPRRLQVTPTPRPVSVLPIDSLRPLQVGGNFPESATAAFGANDKRPPGQVFHGIAAEWDGKLIGGNFTPSGETARAWEVMKARVQPDRRSAYRGDQLDQADDRLRNWGAFDDLVRCYKIVMHEKLLKLHPEADFPALLYSYAGTVPGPTLRFRHGMPCVVRFENQLQTETSIHHHGGHNPTHADGFPSFYVLQGEARDYLYPNILPLRQADKKDGKQITEMDFGEGQSTTWYHDHGLDATAFNVAHGLAGFALWFDELELKLIRDGKLPGLGAISAAEITISEAEYQTWLVEWLALRAVASNQNHGGAEHQLVEEWITLAVKVPQAAELAMEVRASEPVRKAAQEILAPTNTPPEPHNAWQALRAAVKEVVGASMHKPARTDFESRTEDPQDKQFYHRRSRNDLPGLGTPYFNPYDLPIVLQDRVINLDTGQIVYDDNGHNGYIGNVQLLNGRPWPAFKVKRRKYRLRLLDGSNARIYQIRFLDSDTFQLRPTGDGNGELEPANIPDSTLEARAMDFYRIGKDSWLWPTPRRTKRILLNMANRADLVVDFRAWYEAARSAGRLVPDPEDPSRLVAEYYMVNTMPQFDGRGPGTDLDADAGDPNVFPLPFTLPPGNPIVATMVAGGVIPAEFLGAGPNGQIRELNQPIGLMKFIIEDDVGEGEDCPLWQGESTILRPRHAIADEEVMAVREFVFERGKGAWMINSRFYDPTISNASPIIGIKGQQFRSPDGSKPESERASVDSLTYAEEWVLRNGGGGWWHPIHIHLEGHQLIGYEKDFEADEFVGDDGLLAVQGQANMNQLPPWPDLVGKYGFDALNGGTLYNSIKEALIGPRQDRDDAAQTGRNDFAADFVNQAGNLLPLALSVRDAGAALFTELRRGPTITRALAGMTVSQRNDANRILDALDVLRLQWAGEVVGNHDTQALGPNTIARIRMRFRTWTGPLVFHCHNVEHEDMRMMGNFEPTMSGLANELNIHDPNIAPAARSHGQDVTDLNTNPHAVGEMPWEAIDGFPHYAWEEKPVPGTPVDQARDPLIKPRAARK